MDSTLTLTPNEFLFVSEIERLEALAYNSGTSAVNIAGAVGPIGTVVPVKVGSFASKSVAGAETSTGDVPQITIWFNGLAGEAGIVGTVQVAVHGSAAQGIGGSVAPIGTLIVKGRKILSGVINPVGVFVKLPRKILDASITPVGNVIATTAYNPTTEQGIIGPVGSLIVKARLILSGSIGPSSPPITIITASIPGRQVGGTIGPVGVITKIYIRKTLQGFIGPTGLGDPHKVGAPPVQPSGSVITYRRRRR